MKLKELVAPTMKELFIQEITKQILSGHVKVGEKLPTEREMQHQMKVSRTIINSGLSELARIGFVDIIPRQGAFVADYIRKGNIETLVAIMNFNGGNLDRHTFNSLMDYRSSTECECAYLAAKNRTPEDLSRLKTLYQQIIDENDPTTVAHLKVDFHHILYCATGNDIYPLVFNSFNKLSFTFNEIIFKNYGIESAYLSLPELIKAIEDQNPDEARYFTKKLALRRMQQLNHYYYKEDV